MGQQKQNFRQTAKTNYKFSRRKNRISHPFCPKFIEPKSCPPIAFYTFQNRDKQLGDTLYSFIVSEMDIDMHNKTIITSKLGHWYSCDFDEQLELKAMITEVFEIDLTNHYRKLI